jgi:acyl transferase domain-containing protein
MIAVPLSEDDVVPILKDIAQNHGSTGLTIACYNSKNNLTISGDEDQIDSLKTVLGNINIQSHKLKVDLAYHSPHMYKIAASYHSLIQDLSAGDCPDWELGTMVSSVTGDRISGPELRSSEYWVRNLVSPVRFHQALAQICAPETNEKTIKIDRSHRRSYSIDRLIEIGPHSALRGPIRETIEEVSPKRSIPYSSALARNQDSVRTMLNLAGQLHSAGYMINIDAINRPAVHSRQKPRLLHDLPQYCFDDTRKYWQESRISKNFRFGNRAKHDLIGKPVLDWNPLNPRWRNFLGLSNLPWVGEHKV